MLYRKLLYKLGKDFLDRQYVCVVRNLYDWESVRVIFITKNRNHYQKLHMCLWRSYCTQLVSKMFNFLMNNYN